MAVVAGKAQDELKNIILETINLGEIVEIVVHESIGGILEKRKRIEIEIKLCGNEGD